MMTALTVSTVLLAGATLVLGVIALALARQIGVLHERLAPIGMHETVQGLRTGQSLPAITTTTIEGESAVIGGSRAKALALLVVGPDCPVCKRTLGRIGPLASERGYDLALLGEGDADALRAMAARTNLPAPLLLSQELLLLLQVSRLPTLLTTRTDGRIATLGTAGSASELDRLLPAVSSAQTPERVQHAHI